MKRFVINPRRALVQVALFLLVLTALPVLAEIESRDVLRIGDVSVTTLDLEAEFAAMTPEQRERILSSSTGVARMAGTLFYWRMIAREAEAQDLHLDPLVERRLQLGRERLLGSAHLAAENSTVFPADRVEALARAEYAVNPDKYATQEQFRARHILVRDEAPDGSKRGDGDIEARVSEIVAALNSGRDFVDVAREFSEDPGSRRRGGNLGAFGPGQMVKEFEDALRTLKPGEVSGPVKTQFGVHLIELLEHQPATTPTFEDVRERAMADTRARLVSDYRNQRGEEFQNHPELESNTEVLQEFIEQQRAK